MPTPYNAGGKSFCVALREETLLSPLDGSTRTILNETLVRRYGKRRKREPGLEGSEQAKAETFEVSVEGGKCYFLPQGGGSV